MFYLKSKTEEKDLLDLGFEKYKGKYLYGKANSVVIVDFQNPIKCISFGTKRCKDVEYLRTIDFMKHIVEERSSNYGMQK